MGACEKKTATNKFARSASTNDVSSYADPFGFGHVANCQRGRVLYRIDISLPDLESGQNDFL